jgi:hypothetical protein
LEDNYPKRSVRGQQNPNLIFGCEGKFENMKFFLAVSLCESMDRDCMIVKMDSGIQLLHRCLSAGSQVTLRTYFHVHARTNFSTFVLCCNLRNNLLINIFFEFMGNDLENLR